jgi:putative effector of murein hydrolase LrgA (UPF0299 family)
MLKGIITLLAFQFIGECIAKLFDLLVPGPVIGMVLLLIFLIIKKSSFESLDNAVAIYSCNKFIKTHCHLIIVCPNDKEWNYSQ